MGTEFSDIISRDSIRLDYSETLLSSFDEARLTFKFDPSQEYKFPFTAMTRKTLLLIKQKVIHKILTIEEEWFDCFSY